MVQMAIHQILSFLYICFLIKTVQFNYLILKLVFFSSQELFAFFYFKEKLIDNIVLIMIGMFQLLLFTIKLPFKNSPVQVKTNIK